MKASKYKVGDLVSLKDGNEFLLGEILDIVPDITPETYKIKCISSLNYEGGSVFYCDKPELEKPYKEKLVARVTEHCTVVTANILQSFEQAYDDAMGK